MDGISLALPIDPIDPRVQNRNDDDEWQKIEKNFKKF